MQALFYGSIVLALALAAVAGGLYFYVMFLEGRGRQQRRRIAELERVNAALLEELGRGGRPRGDEAERDWWPEVIDEGGGLSLH